MAPIDKLQDIVVRMLYTDLHARASVSPESSQFCWCDVIWTSFLEAKGLENLALVKDYTPEN